MSVIPGDECQVCANPIPESIMRRAIDEKKDLRCKCGTLRPWKSLPPLKSLKAAPRLPTRPSDLITIKDAKDYIDSRLTEGVSCPCCGRNNKRYQRPLDAGIARGLVALVRASPAGEVVHVKDIPSMLVDGVAWTSHDFAKARYWGLCEEVSDSDLPVEVIIRAGRKRKKGFWRSTDKGRRFVFSMVKVPKYASVLNNNFEKLHGDDWSIQDALGQPFDFYELSGVALSND